MKPIVNVAAIQINSGSDTEKNFETIFRLSKRIKPGSVDLITLPEVFPFCGSEEEDLKYAEPYKTHSAIKFLKKLAKSTRSLIAGGTITVREPGSKKVLNKSVLVDSKGKILSHYDKIHLFDVSFKGGTFKESKNVMPGKKIVVKNSPIGKLGFAICYDLRFPELFRAHAKKGAEIILVPAAFITKTGPYHWEALLRARAIENQVFIIATNQYGTHSKTRHTWGGSVIIDPWGTVLARASTYTKKTNKPYSGEIIRARLDRKVLEDFRNKMPCLKNARLL